MTAWMIRNNGKAIPCLIHLYADAEVVEEILAVAEWLHANTRNDETRKLSLETIAAWGDTLHGVYPIQHIFMAIEKQPYRFLSMEFTMDNISGIVGLSTEDMQLDSLCNEVNAELNQEFLRSRYGGMYNTDAPSKDMYFRISSIGFDWCRIICNFLTSVPLEIEIVTIVRDEESTGAKNVFYQTDDGRAFNRFPIDEFLAGQGSYAGGYSRLTVLGKEGWPSDELIASRLSAGASFRQLLSLNMNHMRIAKKLEKIAY